MTYKKYNKCSRDSSSALKIKADKGESTILNQWSLLLVKIIWFKILYWSSLSLVFNLVSKAKEYNFFPSIAIAWSGYLFKIFRSGRSLLQRSEEEETKYPLLMIFAASHGKVFYEIFVKFPSGSQWQVH